MAPTNGATAIVSSTMTALGALVLAAGCGYSVLSCAAEPAAKPKKRKKRKGKKGSTSASRRRSTSSRRSSTSSRRGSTSSRHDEGTVVKAAPEPKEVEAVPAKREPEKRPVENRSAGRRGNTSSRRGSTSSIRTAETYPRSIKPHSPHSKREAAAAREAMVRAEAAAAASARARQAAVEAQARRAADATAETAERERLAARKAEEKEAIRWCTKGAFARQDSKVGEVTMNPDSDAEVKVKWSDGTESGYIKAAALAQATTSEQQSAASWCTPGTAGKYRGKIGTLTMSPDSDAEVKLKWDDGGSESKYLKAVRVHPLTSAEADERKPAARESGRKGGGAPPDVHLHSPATSQASS